jgi:hypothetical protein
MLRVITELGYSKASRNVGIATHQAMRVLQSPISGKVERKLPGDKKRLAPM